MSVFLICDARGVELASSPCIANALRIMNSLDGAERVIRDDGVLLATRHRINADSVSAWFTNLGRWIS